MTAVVPRLATGRDGSAVLSMRAPGVSSGTGAVIEGAVPVVGRTARRIVVTRISCGAPSRKRFEGDAVAICVGRLTTAGRFLTGQKGSRPKVSWLANALTAGAIVVEGTDQRESIALTGDGAHRVPRHEGHAVSAGVVGLTAGGNDHTLLSEGAPASACRTVTGPGDAVITSRADLVVCKARLGRGTPAGAVLECLAVSAGI